LVILLQSRNRAHRNRLLGNAGMGGATDQTLNKERHHVLLQLTDGDHLAVKAEKLLLGKLWSGSNTHLTILPLVIEPSPSILLCWERLYFPRHLQGSGCPFQRHVES